MTAQQKHRDTGLPPLTTSTPRDQIDAVVAAGICTGCGACVACGGELARMRRTNLGPVPDLQPGATIPDLAWHACSGAGIDYPALYRTHYGRLPDDWRIGIVEQMWTGYAVDPETRRAGASGGVTSQVLIYLLEQGLIDGAILARQGIPSPEEASWFIARSREEILQSAQSVYIPVSMLDALPGLTPNERYAMTCVPEQSAALRVLQHGGHKQARQVEFVLGPYTGTALYPAAIRTLLRSKGVRDEDAITSLKWRAGEWPGYLEIKTASGREIRSKKVYYNFLIPFFVTQTSLQSMDFANEFTDLSVGDAWSPKFEALGAGFSVIAARNPKMAAILEEMQAQGLLDLTPVDPVEASAMHGHMIDFKKRGGYLRNRWRRITGRAAPDYGLRPEPIGLSRIIVEIVISTIFALAGTRAARKIVEWIPESILGPLFNNLRLFWKSASKPAKRKGLADLRMIPTSENE
jgi:coenzyme F420 hydrogenase subunit beta